MNNGVRTVISCPCCQRLFIENYSNTRQWNAHKQRTDLQQFRKYLNLVLSRSNEGIMAKGRHVKLGEKEQPDFTPTTEERKSLLYQTEFIAKKKREASESELQSGLVVKKLCNNLKTYNQRDITDGMNQLEQARKMNERRAHYVERSACAPKLPNDLVIRKCDGNDFKKFNNAVDLKRKKERFERRKKVEGHEMLLPTIPPESHGEERCITGSTVVQFTGENTKLDIFLPTLM